MIDFPLLLDAKQAAAILGVSRLRFLAMHSAGKVPLPMRLGRRCLWDVCEPEAWVDAGAPCRARWEGSGAG